MAKKRTAKNREHFDTHGNYHPEGGQTGQITMQHRPDQYAKYENQKDLKKAYKSQRPGGVGGRKKPNLRGFRGDFTQKPSLKRVTGTRSPITGNLKRAYKKTRPKPKARYRPFSASSGRRRTTRRRSPVRSRVTRRAGRRVSRRVTRRRGR